MQVSYVFDEIEDQDCSRVRKKLGLPRNTRDNDELIHHSNNDFQNKMPDLADSIRQACNG